MSRICHWSKDAKRAKGTAEYSRQKSVGRERWNAYGGAPNLGYWKGRALGSDVKVRRRELILL